MLFRDDDAIEKYRQGSDRLSAEKKARVRTRWVFEASRGNRAAACDLTLAADLAAAERVDAHIAQLSKDDAAAKVPRYAAADPARGLQTGHSEVIGCVAATAWRRDARGSD